MLRASTGQEISGYRQLIVLALIILAVGVIYVALNPWAFVMGGNFHPLGYWQGCARCVPKTARYYVLYVRIYPKMQSTGALIPGTSVKGDAFLCTPKGERFYLNLGAVACPSATP